jgi:hypothetical protein
MRSDRKPGFIGGKMKSFFSILGISILVAVLSANSAMAGAPCKLKPLDGGEFGQCTSEEFTVALWNGDMAAARSLIEKNPNLLYSCNFSTSFVYNGGMPEILNPSTFVACHSVYDKKIELLQLLLESLPRGEINCESQNLKITAKQCLSRIDDSLLREKVEELLRKHGMN